MARIGLIVVGLGAQLWVSRATDVWYAWLLYLLAAVAAAVVCSPRFNRRSAFAVPRDSGPEAASPRPALRPIHLSAALLAVAAAAAVTEWSAAGVKNGAAVAAWLTTFVALTIAAWGLRVSPGRRSTPQGPASNLHLIAFGVVVVAALLLRTLWIDELPRVYFADESRAGVWVRDSYRNGLPNLFTMGWNTWSMIGLSLQGMFAPLLGWNTVGVRLASASFGTAAVVSTYLLARELFDRRVALFAAAILAFNRTAIDFSRLGTTHAQVLFFESLTFFALWRAINTGSAVAYVWTGMLAALCLHSYNAAHVVPALLVGWLVLTILALGRRMRAYVGGAALVLAGFALIGLPWFYYVTDHWSPANNWLQYTWMAHARQVTPQVVEKFYGSGLGAAAELCASQIWKTWLGFTVIPAEAYGLGYRGGGMLDHVGAALFVLGLAVAFTAGTRGAFVLYWWGVTALVGGALTIDPPAFVRMVGLIPAVCILAGLAMSMLLNAEGRAHRVSAIAAGVLLVAVLADNWRTYFVEFASSSADDMSELVHLVRSTSPASPIYLLGAENFLHFTNDVDVRQFVFDFPDRTLRDVAEPARFLPIRHATAAAPTYLVLGPSQLTLEDSIVRLYPHAEAVDVKHRQNGRLFFRYLRLTPEDVEARAEKGEGEPASDGHGLKVSYERDGGIVLERIEPQINAFTMEGFFREGHVLPVESPYRTRWIGALDVETPGTYHFEVVTSGPTSVDLGGERVCNLPEVRPERPSSCVFERNLAAGPYAVLVHWEAIKSPHSSRQVLQMYWTPPNGARSLIPTERFLPGTS